MNTVLAAQMMGIPPSKAQTYIQSCDEVVESGQYVATLKGATVHIAAKVNGLGGRKLLRDCRGTLRAWFEKHGTLYAPVRPHNRRALRLAIGLGFHEYATTDTHVWLMQTKEHFNGN